MRGPNLAAPCYSTVARQQLQDPARLHQRHIPRADTCPAAHTQLSQLIVQGLRNSIHKHEAHQTDRDPLFYNPPVVMATTIATNCSSRYHRALALLRPLRKQSISISYTLHFALTLGPHKHTLGFALTHCASARPVIRCRPCPHAEYLLYAQAPPPRSSSRVPVTAGPAAHLHEHGIQGTTY